MKKELLRAIQVLPSSVGQSLSCLLGTKFLRIVAPLSVLSNWSTQIGEHVTAEAVCKVHVYYGEGRDAKASFLRQQDIVLTTYQMLAADFSEVKTTANPDDIGTPQVKAIKMGLFAVKWKVRPKDPLYLS